MTHAELAAKRNLEVSTFAAEARAAWKVLGGVVDAGKVKAEVVVKYTSPRRFQHNMTVAGPAEAVALYVGMVLETDSCTPHYEHMLWSVFSIERNGGLVMAELGRSSSAGD